MTSNMVAASDGGTPSRLTTYENKWAERVDRGATRLFTSPDNSIAGFCLRGNGAARDRADHADAVLALQRSNSSIQHFVVVDGMGPHDGINTAAVIIEHAEKGLKSSDDLAQIIRVAPQAVLEVYQAQGKSGAMGAVVVGGTVHSTGRVFIPYAGDSQYLRVSRRGVLQAISPRHNGIDLCRAYRVQKGSLDPKSMAPLCGVVVSDGAIVEHEEDCLEDLAYCGDRLIWLSDGVVNLLGIDAIVNHSKKSPTVGLFRDSVRQEILQSGLRGDASDNLTMVAADPPGPLAGKYGTFKSLLDWGQPTRLRPTPWLLSKSKIGD